MHADSRNKISRPLLRDFILGGQDGLVNVLGIILGVAVATGDVRIVIIAGLAATFAESISMAAVAYTSTKAAKDYYKKELEKEIREIREIPEAEKKEIYDIYYRKGFRGPLLATIVRKITSNKKIWLDTMMSEELHMYKEEYQNPAKSAAVVFIAAMIGSIVPILPFLFMPINAAVIGAIVVSLLALFIAGAYKARITVGEWWKGGLEIAIIGLAAALIGYVIGAALAGLLPPGTSSALLYS